MKNIKIVFADDDIVARKLVLKLLADKEFNIITAENGKEAWKLLNDSGARLIVTDWNMPEMNGIDLCRKIRQTCVSQYIYIILITSRSEKEDTIEGLKAGADDFVVKPLNVGELRARIRSGLRIIKLEDEFKKANTQLLQSEKMASVGQLAAGIAHEINNPIGFVSSNLRTLTDYRKDFNTLLGMYRSLKKNCQCCSNEVAMKMIEEIESFEKDIDIEFMVTDSEDLIRESRDGVERVKKIVIDLKDFAHPGEDTMQQANINACIDSTLNVIWNEIKYKAEVKKDYGDLPLVTCYPHQLNQVFMNIIMNAVQAIDSKGTIKITTETSSENVRIKIRDNGCGIDEKDQSRIFDPFFTTKEVGKGTGLGMNVAYNIIQKHNGTIGLESKVGIGTEFTIVLPVDQNEDVPSIDQG